MRTTSRQKIDLAAALAASVEQPASELTLAELVNAFCVAKCDGSDTRLRKWVAAMGHFSAWTVTSEQLETAAQAMLDHGYKTSAVNRDLSALGSVYRWAKEKRLSPRGYRSPTLGVRRYDEPIRRVHIEREQVDALRARALAFRDRSFGVYVALLIDTGARKSELLERRWRDVDLERREVLAPITKNGTPRVLFFSEETAALIQRVFPTRKADELMFQGRVPGQPISFRKAWETLAAEAKMPTLRMHDIRHAAAASLLRAGVTLGVAAQVLGHDPAVLARRYGHLETEALRKAQETAWAST
ncbi:site-specific integrase [Pseudorhodoferax sp. Leaf267]|uniref:tyrosine-type recombinase/integrase n=1 Tax=Pseudorhodoferax sp. Leaf267 TaxID=1736316 RepID=UPI0012E2C869|nr:site-specific integrase [Pseudorhodoferax sp. Leaf267]